MRKYYFINKFDTNNIDKQDKQTTIIYRNYSSKPTDQRLILKIKKYCKQKSIKFYLSNNIKLAIKHRLNGVYIPSFNKVKNFNFLSKPNDFIIIGSAHNRAEIKLKEDQGCNLIFLAPIFKVNKKIGFLGINKFNLLTVNSKSVFIALGGINQKNIKKLKLLNCEGFAGISWIKKTAQKINFGPF